MAMHKCNEIMDLVATLGVEDCEMGLSGPYGVWLHPQMFHFLKIKNKEEEEIWNKCEKL